MKYLNLFNRAAFALSSILLLATFSGFAVCEDLQRIGLITPLSGPVAPHGHAVLDGLKLGLKAGGCDDKIQLFVEDDGFETKRSVSASQKLLTQDKVQILMTVGSGPTHGVAPISDQYKIPFLALAGDSSAASGHPFTIRLRPPARYEGKLIAQLAKSENAKSVVMLCSSNEFTLAICDTVSSELGDKVIFRTNILPDETDFKTIIAKIRVLNPSHIIPIFLPGKLGIFARQTKELKLNKPFLGGVFFESSSDLETSRGSLYPT